LSALGHLGRTGGNPDDLLMQIAQLLGQYLSLGANTPVAPEAQQLMDAIQQTVGAGGQGAGTDPTAGGTQPPSADQLGVAPDQQGAMPDLTGMQPSAPPKSNSGGHPFSDVSKMLNADIKNRKKTKAR
jgi:hypothetical protein